MSKLRARLTYANVMATVAVFLALGGGAIAAFKLPKKSVGTKQLRARAVKTNKLADGAVTDAKVAAGTLTAAKIAPGQVLKGVYVLEEVCANNGAGAFCISDLQCAVGDQAIGGGGGSTNPLSRIIPSADTSSAVLSSIPIDASGRAVASGQTPTGWHSVAQHSSGTNKDVRVYTVCARR